MAFYGYKEDLDKYYWNPYNTSCDYEFASTPIQTSSQYSPPYEFVEPEIVQYEPIEYHSSYNYYEYYSINEPKLLEYESPSYARVYFPSEMKFTIFYSTAEPELEEYDPTPYGGGYDPVTTYGKPIPHSDITCYPRSVPQSDSISLENLSYASIPSPYGKDDDLPIKPPNGSNTKDDSAKNADEQFENGTRGDYGYENERQVTQIPYGSGLEAMDLCESLFGYWPCLAKRAHEEQRSKCRGFCDQERRMDPWESAADYLFGSPLVCDYENYHQQQQRAQYENS